MLTLKELSSQTGLSENIIRKYVRLMRSFLAPYIKRGQSNKLLFDHNCMVIFNEVKKLRDSGKNTKEIINIITDTYANSKDISYEAVQTDQTTQIDQTRQQIHDLYNMLLAEKDRLIQEMDKRDLRIVRLEIEKVKLQESLKLLPGGRKPVKLKKEWDNAAKRSQTAISTLNMLKKTSCFRFRKRKNLLAKLEEHIKFAA